MILIHGDNIEASRNELNKLKEGAIGKEIRVLDGAKIDTTSLTQAFESNSLFGNETIVIIERLLSKLNKKNKDSKSIFDLLIRNADNCEIILWEDREIEASTIKNLGAKVKILSFKYPTIIFEFLDNIHPGNAKNSLLLFQKLTNVQPVEPLMSMIVKRIQHLVMLNDGVKPASLADWQAGRLTRQAKMFTIEQLITMQEQLLKIDTATKTGSSPFSLSQQLGQFIINL